FAVRVNHCSVSTPRLYAKYDSAFAVPDYRRRGRSGLFAVLPDSRFAADRRASRARGDRCRQAVRNSLFRRGGPLLSDLGHGFRRIEGVVFAASGCGVFYGANCEPETPLVRASDGGDSRFAAVMSDASARGAGLRL